MESTALTKFAITLKEFLPQIPMETDEIADRIAEVGVDGTLAEIQEKSDIELSKKVANLVELIHLLEL